MQYVTILFLSFEFLNLKFILLNNNYYISGVMQTIRIVLLFKNKLFKIVFIIPQLTSHRDDREFVFIFFRTRG